uniref:Sorting nexin 29 n=1 Tax=Rousettus aegyptiacus TaxID=9407 RepID=A0A7J8F3N4_ROUAE|nr:sorting nexin 29 [Rousettus aegyptiacus]
MMRPLDGNTCLSQRHSWAPLQVLHGDTDILFPVSGVGSYNPADAPLGSLENGTGAQDRVRPEPGPRYSVEASPPGPGSPLSSLLPSASVPESMTINELRQAIVAMMNRKEELEEENRSLRNLLDGEMEHSAALRQEVDALKRKLAEQEERHVMKIQALARAELPSPVPWRAPGSPDSNCFSRRGCRRNPGGRSPQLVAPV